MNTIAVMVTPGQMSRRTMAPTTRGKTIIQMSGARRKNPGKYAGLLARNTAPAKYENARMVVKMRMTRIFQGKNSTKPTNASPTRHSIMANCLDITPVISDMPDIHSLSISGYLAVHN